jgi:hypothetical protein
MDPSSTETDTEEVVETTDGSTDVVRETRPVAGEVRGGALRSTHSIAADSHEALRERYGGFYWGSDFIGFAVAMFFTLVLLGIVGAIVGGVGYQLNAPVPDPNSTTLSETTKNLGIGALAGSLIAVFLAYVIGGYTAGRMARFDGPRNGVGVVIWTVIVAVALGVVGAIIGDRFNVAQQLHLNIDATTLTAAGAISLLVTLVVMLLGAMLGGWFGERFHRDIDRDATVGL